MLHKGKLLVFLLSAVIVLYGVSAAFYGKVVARDEAYPALAVFMDALKKIDQDYVEAPDMNKVQEGAMRGLVEALDPYSSYLSKDLVQQLEKHTPGEGHAGMVLSKRTNVIYVVSTQQGGAAAEAGVRPGDYLISVDDVQVEDKSLVEVDSMLRGEPGAKVKVTVFRSAQTKPVELELALRDGKPIPVVSRRLDGNIGVLEIPSLAAPTLEQARIKLKTLVSAGAEKLVLDLRDCADGDADNGAELANLFLKSGVIYTSRNRDGKILQEVQAAPEKSVTDLPMVVLINSSTAGAAEIASGALKDLGRAKLVGEKSFGLGSAQKRIQLKSGAALILSTAKYYTPEGKMIQEDSIRTTGIQPDVESPDSDRRQELAVESYFDDKEEAAKYKELRDRIRQEQFDKAVEVLTGGPQTAKRAA